ncbi:MAG: insulinase family protein [Clostridiales bacterium]|nr:insulinase family protein [Clostridiales bacterium]
MVEIKKLDCGFRMASEYLPHVQSAALGIWVKAGSVDEAKKEEGISHLIEHMLFKGTETRSAKEIAQAFDRIGGNINAFTGKEATCYFVKTLTSNLETAVDVLLDMLLNSVFDPMELEKEKNVIYEEINMIEDSPEDDIHDMLDGLVFAGTPLESPIIGSVETLSAMDRNDIKRYMAREYVRDSMVLSVAGNFNEERIREIFEGKLSVLGADKEIKTYESELYVPQYLVKAKDVEQSHISIGLPGLALDDRLYHAMALLSNIFGGSMSSRLFQNIREEKGLAYSVYSAASSHTKHGIFCIYAGVSHKNVAKTIEAIKDEMRILKAEGVTKGELSAAKEQLKSNYIFTQESVNSRMFSIGKNATLMGRVRTPEEVLALVDGVTMDDIMEAAEIMGNIEKYSGALITRQETDLKSLILN